MSKGPIREQVETEGVSVRQIMSSPEFAQGVADVRTSAPPRFDKADWDAWFYELPLKKSGRVTPAAMKFYTDLIP